MNLTKMTYYEYRPDMHREIERRAEAGVCMHCGGLINKNEGRIGYCSLTCGTDPSPIKNWVYEKEI